MDILISKTFISQIYIDRNAFFTKKIIQKNEKQMITLFI